MERVGQAEIVAIHTRLMQHAPTRHLAGQIRTIYAAIEQLLMGNVLTPLSTSKRNRAWEANGLLTLIERLEAGQLPE